MSTVLSKNKDETATTTKKRDGLLKTELYNTFTIDIVIPWNTILYYVKYQYNVSYITLSYNIDK